MINEIMKRLSELPNVTMDDGQEYIQLYDAMETVKRALEQEPCENAISREEILLMIDSFKDNYGSLIDLSREVRKMPPVNSQRQTGHWIDNHNNTISCDHCHTWFNKDDRYGYMHYCPYCNIKIVELQERERMNEVSD